jgi:hypothetical protein
MTTSKILSKHRDIVGLKTLLDFHGEGGEGRKDLSFLKFPKWKERRWLCHDIEVNQPPV